MFKTLNDVEKNKKTELQEKTNINKKSMSYKLLDELYWTCMSLEPGMYKKVKIDVATFALINQKLVYKTFYVCKQNAKKFTILDDKGLCLIGIIDSNGINYTSAKRIENNGSLLVFSSVNCFSPYDNKVEKQAICKIYKKAN